MKWLRLFFIYPFISLLPARMAYRLAELAYCYDPELRRPTRIAVANGMRMGLPSEPDSEQIRTFLADHQRMMGRELLDVYFLPRLSPRNIDRWVTVKGAKHLMQPRADGRGRILAMAHFSRPSLLFAALGIKGVKLNILTQAIDHANSDLDWIDRLYLRFKVWANRRHMLGDWITVSENPRRLYNLLLRGETLVVLFDLRTTAEEPRVIVPFLGHKLAFPQGVDRLIKKTGAALYYGAIRDRNWQVDIEITELDVKKYDRPLESAIAKLEHEVQSNPANWWQWNIFEFLLAKENQNGGQYDRLN